MIITGKLDNPQPFGRYVLTARVAAGGMATVYLAQAQVGDALNGKPLALKHLHPHLSENEDFVRMFLDEGRVAKQLDHPNVVRVYDVGTVDSDYYLVMEYVDGRDLAQLITALRLKGQLMPAPIAFEVLRQTLTALAYVHAFKGSGTKRMGIVHRDISPHNILISRHPMVKVTDFGIARGAHRTDRTRTGTVKGKIEYMSPEQAQGEHVDQRADLYAVGAVAFELLTGRPPVTAEKTAVAHRKVVSGELDLEGRFKTQPEDVKEWLLRALAKDPADRFQSAEAMLAAMELVAKADRNKFRPEQLARLLDLEEARRSVQRDAKRALFVGDEAMDSGRLAGAVSRPYSAVHESKVRGPVSHVDLSGEERRSRLERKVDWQQTGPEPRPPTEVRLAGDGTRPRGRVAAEMLPAERAAGKSYAVTPSGEHPAVRPASAGSGALPALAAAARSSELPAVSAASGDSGRRGVSKISRGDLDRERGIALATAGAWLCGAFVSFAVLLEVVGWTPELPSLDERMVASLVGAEPEARIDASAGSPAHPRPPTIEPARPTVSLPFAATASVLPAVALGADPTAAVGAPRKPKVVDPEDLARSAMEARPLERVVPFDAPDGERSRTAKAGKPALPKPAVAAGAEPTRAAVAAAPGAAAKVAAAKPVGVGKPSAGPAAAANVAVGKPGIVGKASGGAIAARAPAAVAKAGGPGPAKGVATAGVQRPSPRAPVAPVKAGPPAKAVAAAAKPGVAPAQPAPASRPGVARPAPAVAASRPGPIAAARPALPAAPRAGTLVQPPRAGLPPKPGAPKALAASPVAKAAPVRPAPVGVGGRPALPTAAKPGAARLAPVRPAPAGVAGRPALPGAAKPAAAKPAPVRPAPIAGKVGAAPAKAAPTKAGQPKPAVGAPARPAAQGAARPGAPIAANRAAATGKPVAKAGVPAQNKPAAGR